MCRDISYIGLPWNVGFFHFFSPLTPQPSNYSTLTSDSTSRPSKSIPVKILHYEPCVKGQSEVCVRKSVGSNKNATKYYEADRTDVKRLKRSTTVATPKSSKTAEQETDTLEKESKVG